jgi:TonB family protein
MRALGLALSLAGASLAAPLASRAEPAKPPPAAPAHAAAAAPESDAVLIFYPAAARAAGTEGKATIRCSRDEHLALVNCSLVSETPTGQGFGAAALAMAAQSKSNPKVDIPEMKTEASADVTIQFALHPPTVTPDITRMAHVVTNPSILVKPTKAQIQAAYPVRAMDDQVQGAAVIVCTVNVAGLLESCRVGQEQPGGYGFGQAAVDLATDFKMAPGKLDGDAVNGSPVRISIAFTSDDPTAPLSLDTKPAPP